MLRNHDFICFNMGLRILGTELWVPSTMTLLMLLSVLWPS